jgi:hypothetical protein
MAKPPSRRLPETWLTSATSGDAAIPMPSVTLAASRRWPLIRRVAASTKPQASACAAISTPVVDRHKAIAAAANATSRAPPEPARIIIEITSGAQANASTWRYMLTQESEKPPSAYASAPSVAAAGLYPRRRARPRNVSAASGT